MKKILKKLRKILSIFIPNRKVRHLFVNGELLQYWNYKKSLNKKFKYNLSVVLIIKNAAQYMDEWLCYHKIVGVDHFYIYDNESEDNLKEVLDPYIKKGWVTYTYWPGKKQQLTVYDVALKEYRNETKWMAFIDDDEFIVPVQGKTIPEIMDEIGVEAGLLLSEVKYGTSGQKKKSEALCIERFRYRQKLDRETCSLSNTKSIVNPRVAISVPIHRGIFISGFQQVDENRTVLNFSDIVGSWNKIRYNHYHTKSEEEFLRKKSRGDAHFGNYTPDFKSDFNSNNDVYDDIMDKYVDPVKNLIKEIRGK